MKRIAAVGLALLCAAAGAAAEDQMLQAGMVAPEFTATTFDGKQVSLAALRADGPVVLVLLRSCS